MKHRMIQTWAAICAVWASMLGTVSVYATEQVTEAVQEVSPFLHVMDVMQKVCLVIVIAVAVIMLAFYVFKMILKSMHVPPQEKDKEKTDEK